jgi:uncharacterized RDD family membrane protein YckC
MDNLRYKTGLKRLGAALIDGVIFIPFVFIQNWLFDVTESLAVKIAWTIFVLFLSFFYSIFLHYKYGQTFGKWVAGVKVLNIDESKTMTLKQSVIRDSFYLVTEVLALLYFTFLFFGTSQPDNLFDNYREFNTYPTLIWTLLELISMLTNNKRRAVHDFLAKSVVVRL